MIPLHLRISGFLSYRDTVELDLKAIDLACISGHNGAGKSSLLDAITWCLFGEARGKSSEVINLHADVKAAEVALIFQHEGTLYRVQRTLPRNKSTLLEFQIQGAEGWRPLTEKTTRETQARIEQTLRLDYETFVNASFFLQGKADQFTQQNAARRKEVLSSILGLEAWEEYKNRAAERRRAIEHEVDEIEGRLTEIEAELSEEHARKARLAELEATLQQIASARAAQEAVLENIKQNAALLEKQRNLSDTLSHNLQRARAALAALETRLASRESDRNAYLDLLHRAVEIEAAYLQWQDARKQVTEWEKIASQFREYEQERAPLLQKIASERARLEEERRALRTEAEAIHQQASAIDELKREIERAQALLKEAETQIAERADLETKRSQARERQSELKVENESLKSQMDELKARIERLKSAEGSACPLCGQPLSEDHRLATLQQLETEGKQKGSQYRANLKESATLAEQIAAYESRIRQLHAAENNRIQYSGEISRLTERVERLQALASDWETSGKPRLQQVESLLENETFAADEQRQLAHLDSELAKLGYNASAHDEARRRENELRHVEEEYSSLKSAKEASRQIEQEIAALQVEIANRRAEIEHLDAEYQSALTTLTAIEAQLPDLEKAERDLFRLREEENKARAELGGAQQRVNILQNLRARKKDLEKEREELRKQIARHKTLERAFSKDGVPALLIEQALPQIEDKANEILDRLSDGQMSIRFLTQTQYKDKKRDDLKETLEIQISDGAGTRNYEMYSGGEAFRVNFAIRLALSEILAQRKGARLQTLVIDEGFGSQDAQGLQRLIEAINLVKNDFAKILVITHLDELKDAFPTRIEVEKGERGSTVRIL
jgi:exonuclease SbcC